MTEGLEKIGGGKEKVGEGRGEEEKVGRGGEERGGKEKAGRGGREEDWRGEY